MNKLIVSLASALLAGVATLSCGSGSHPGSSEPTTGTVQATLSTVGPDGATYQLPDSAVLFLDDPSTGAELDYINLDPIDVPGTGSQSFQVPARSYAAVLDGGRDGSAWRLLRTTATGKTYVDATLMDPAQFRLDVAAGQTTSLTFHFVAPSVGDVTFSSGTLNVGLHVDSPTAPAKSVHWTETGTVSLQDLSRANPALQTLMQAPNGTPVQVAVDLVFDEPWTMTTNRACVGGQATVTPTTPHAGLAANLKEVTGGAGYFCVYDAADPSSPNQMYVDAFLVGAPQTAALSQALSGDGGTPGKFEFYMSVWATSPVPIFSGGVLSLSKLEGLQIGQETGPNQGFDMDISDGTTHSSIVYTAGDLQTNDAGAPAATIVVTP